MSMFCYQCEQTAKEVGCSAHGVCGKDPETAALQDVLVQVAKSIGWYAHKQETADRNIDHFLLEALFTTVTNVNFDPETLAVMIRKGLELNDALQAKAKNLKVIETGTGTQPHPTKSNP